MVNIIAKHNFVIQAQPYKKWMCQRYNGLLIKNLGMHHARVMILGYLQNGDGKRSIEIHPHIKCINFQNDMKYLVLYEYIIMYEDAVTNKMTYRISDIGKMLYGLVNTLPYEWVYMSRCAALMHITEDSDSLSTSFLQSVIDLFEFTPLQMQVIRELYYKSYNGNDVMFCQRVEEFDFYNKALSKNISNCLRYMCGSGLICMSSDCVKRKRSYMLTHTARAIATIDKTIKDRRYVSTHCTIS